MNVLKQFVGSKKFWLAILISLVGVFGEFEIVPVEVADLVVKAFTYLLGGIALQDFGKARQ